jgi:hypothetical protein
MTDPNWAAYLEWFACSGPAEYFDYLPALSSDRRVRLFFCGDCRLSWPELSDPRSRAAVKVAEAFADGQAGLAELAAAHQAALQAARREPAEAARWAVAATSPVDWEELYVSGWTAAQQGGVWRRESDGLPSSKARFLGNWVTRWARAGRQKQRRALFRDLCRSPLHGVMDATWLAGQGKCVVQLAHAIYIKRRFADLPVLADALEEAGCTNADILDHCRKPGTHVRGCWVVDLLLGKE